MFDVHSALNNVVSEINSGRMHSAKSICKMIMVVDPQNFNALQFLGTACRRTDDEGAAILWFCRSIYCNYMNEVAYINLANIYLCNSELGKARRLLQIALSISPLSQFSYRHAAICCYEQKHLKKSAMMLYCDCLVNDVDLANVETAIAALEVAKDWSRVINIANKFREKLGERAYFYKLAMSSNELRKFDKAEAALDRVSGGIYNYNAKLMRLLMEYAKAERPARSGTEGRPVTGNVFATFCDSSLYFNGCINLISSIHRTSYHSVDYIVVYTMDLCDDQIDELLSYEKVIVVKFPNFVKNFFEGYCDPKKYAWKPFVLMDAGRFGRRVFYADAGIMFINDISHIFSVIEEDDIFLLESYRGEKGLIGNWTAEKCLKILSATEFEKKSNQISAGIQGYKSGGNYQGYIDLAFELSREAGIFEGEKTYHMFDQSMFSILAQRFMAKTRDFDDYVQYPKDEMDLSKFLYVHRCSFFSTIGARRRASPVHGDMPGP